MGIRYSIDDAFFKEWSPAMAYVFGYIVADGSLEDASYLRGKCVRISSKDFDILERIRNTLRSKHTIREVGPCECWEADGTKKYISSPKYLLRIGCKEIYNDLIALGLCPRKSLNVSLPRITKQYLSHFIRGYFDGDGCVFVENDVRLRVIFTSGSYGFLKDLSIALKKEVGVNLRNINKSTRSYQLNYSTRESLRILNYLYREVDDKLFLERKYNIYLDFLNGDVAERLRQRSAKPCTAVRVRPSPPQSS